MLTDVGAALTIEFVLLVISIFIGEQRVNMIALVAQVFAVKRTAAPQGVWTSITTLIVKASMAMSAYVVRKGAVLALIKRIALLVKMITGVNIVSTTVLLAKEIARKTMVVLLIASQDIIKK